MKNKLIRLICHIAALALLFVFAVVCAAADPGVDMVVVAVHNRSFAADSDGRIVATANDYYKSGSDFVPFGATIYYPILGGEWKGDSQDDGNLNNDSGLMGSKINFWVTEPAAVRSAQITKSWDMGGTMVAGVSVERKRVDFDIKKYPSLKTYMSTDQSGYYYFLAVSFKERTTATERVDVEGTLSLKKTGTDGFWAGGRQGRNTVEADVFVTLGYPYSTELELTSDPRIYYFADSSDSNAIPTSDEEYIHLGSNIGYFVVNTKGQGKIVLSCDLSYDSDFADNYPDVDFTFINCGNAVFKRQGILYIYAKPGEYLYLREGKTLYNVDAEYDDYEGAFILETKTLDSYVISDTSLGAKPSQTLSDSLSSVAPAPGQVDIIGSPSAWDSYYPINPATGAGA